jgi:hypothetical protein
LPKATSCQTNLTSFACHPAIPPDHKIQGNFKHHFLGEKLHNTYYVIFYQKYFNLMTGRLLIQNNPTRRLQWAVHIASIKETNSYRILMEKPLKVTTWKKRSRLY